MKYLIIIFFTLLTLLIVLFTHLLNYKGKIDILHNILIYLIIIIAIIEFLLFWTIVLKIVKMVLLWKIYYI